MIYSNKIHKGVSVLLFLFIFGYLLLRLIFNETLHDEVATFYFYFYHGDYIGETIQWDANNHLLNSFLGAQLYKLFGDNFIVLRLPNLLAFILFFIGSYRLTEQLKTPFLKLTGLLALTCIPFVLDYFAYARGYGLSMGFLMLALYHFVCYQQNFKKKNLLLSYTLLLFAVAANLTLINSAFILMGINIFAPFFQENRNNFDLKTWLIHFYCFVGLLPLIVFALMLKKAGALYYGSLDGLWEITGKSISKMVFFSGNVGLKVFFLIIFIAFNVLFFQKIKKKSKEEWLKQPFILWIGLLYGNIIAILILAFILKVNYPEDRTGMYLIFYALLAFIYFLDNISFGKWLQVSFLFFPITLITHLNLDTSIYSPEQRMNAEFYQKVKAEIKPSHSVMMYQTMFWNWVFNESHQKIKASVGQTNNPNSTLFDIILTREEVLNNLNIPKLYDTIAYHQPSGYIAFKRKIPLIKNPIDSIINKTLVGNGEYFNVAKFKIEGLKFQNLQVDVLGHLKTFVPKNKIQLILETKNETNETVRHFYYSFDACFQGKLIDDDFLHHFIVENVAENEKEIIVYFWNRSLVQMEATKVKTVWSTL